MKERESEREREKSLMGFRLLQIIDVHLFLGHLVKEKKKKSVGCDPTPER